MKIVKLIVIPIVLVIVSIVFYSLSAAQQKKIDSASIIVDGGEKLVNYGGEYKAIVRNIDYDAYYMKIESTSEYLKITTYDQEEIIQKVFGVRIKESNQVYDSSVILNVYSDELIFIDDIDSYLFTISLEENRSYKFQLFRIDDNSDENNIEVEVFNTPNNVYNVKLFFDSLALTTLLFSALYFVGGLVMYFVKKKKISYK
jgi:hypothetical protein